MGLDVLENLVKAIEKKEEVEQMTKTYKVKERKKTPKCVKAMGPGGIQFDFGNSSGNAMADRITGVMQKNADPIQVQTANQQKLEHQIALGRFISKGEERYDREHGRLADNHNTDNMNKSTDEIITKLYKEGNLNVEDTGSLEKSRSGMSRHSGTQMQVGNETVKATSETDAALIEMMKSGNVNFEE